MEVPYGYVGRIGAEYEFHDEAWKLHRVDVDQPKPYIFRSVARCGSFLAFSLKRFLKLTKYWDGARYPWKPYRIPCFQCRRPIPGLGGSFFCDECRPC